MVSRRKHIERWSYFYWHRFFPEFWNDVKARFYSLLISILAAALVLIAQLHFGVITHNGISGRWYSIAAPYALVLICVAIYHATRAPWLISNEHLENIKALEGGNVELERQLTEYRQTPPKLDVRMMELYRNPVNYGKDGNPTDGFLWDIFLAARIELQSPMKASISKYTMQLVLHGNATSLEAMSDITEWGLDIWKDKGLAHADLSPLSKELKVGEPIEGWLHFRSPQANYKTLDECKVRLIANVEHGSAHDEHGPDAAIWNPNNSKRFAHKG